MRPNPAEDGYQLELLRQQLRDLESTVTRMQSDTHSAYGAGGLEYTVSVDPDNPNIILVQYEKDDGSNAISMAPSTLMIPDPTNENALLFPSLAV